MEKIHKGKERKMGDERRGRKEKRRKGGSDEGRGGKEEGIKWKRGTWREKERARET